MIVDTVCFSPHNIFGFKWFVPYQPVLSMSCVGSVHLCGLSPKHLTLPPEPFPSYSQSGLFFDTEITGHFSPYPYHDLTASLSWLASLGSSGKRNSPTWVLQACRTAQARTEEMGKESLLPLRARSVSLPARLLAHTLSPLLHSKCDVFRASLWETNFSGC